MDAQIKEEAKEDSLDLVSFDTSSDNNALPSLSFVEKYNQYIQNEDTELDSDSDFLPDESVLREQFADFAREAHNIPRSNKSHRLSIGLLATTREPSDNCYRKPGSHYNELIEKLSKVRKCGPDGNSVFCTEKELEEIQENYEAILDFIIEQSSTFSERNSPKDSENDEQVDVDDATPEEQNENLKLPAEKIASVQRARDHFYEVEQQVREQIEQLELVERYKMESVS